MIKLAWSSASSCNVKAVACRERDRSRTCVTFASMQGTPKVAWYRFERDVSFRSPDFLWLAERLALTSDVWEPKLAMLWLALAKLPNCNFPRDRIQGLTPFTPLNQTHAYSPSKFLVKVPWIRLSASRRSLSHALPVAKKLASRCKRKTGKWNQVQFQLSGANPSPG